MWLANAIWMKMYALNPGQWHYFTLPSVFPQIQHRQYKKIRKQQIKLLLLLPKTLKCINALWLFNSSKWNHKGNGAKKNATHTNILILNCVEFFILARGFVVIAIFAKPFGESIQNDGNRDTFFKKNIARNQVKARQQEYTKLNRDPLKFQHARQITQN